VSHAFKAYRFVELHCRAIRWARKNTTYVGIDPPYDVTPQTSLETAEHANGIIPWSRDLYGVGEALMRKRELRGWQTMDLVKIERGQEYEEKIGCASGK